LNRKGIVSRRQNAERIRDNSRFQEPPRALVCAHEAIELVPQSVIARADLVEKGRPRFSRTSDRSLE
jgi:hypothetical protein